MKTPFVVSLLTVAVAGCSTAEPPPPPSNAPVPIHTQPARPTAAAAPTASTEQFVYDQKPLTSQPTLVSAQQAQAVVEKFKAAYPQMGSPRLLIYVNRDLVDEKTGFRLNARNEKVETTRTTADSTFKTDSNAPVAGSNSVKIHAGGNVNVTGAAGTPGTGSSSTRTDHVTHENRYKTEERHETVADRQTVRDLERLFGRPLRSAGASLADQRVATQLIASRPIDYYVTQTDSETARKDREALQKITDVVIEILISSRDLLVPEISGDRTYRVPDIQATAIRLSDARILGQASTQDVMGNDGRVAKSFGTQEITEATALALMEDMASGFAK
jgi:hypothetical protein